MSPRWRTPAAILFCGSVILLLAIGIRQSFGLFLKPMSVDLGIGREAFALAIAVQNLLWGVAQPVAGWIADRFGPVRVLGGGGLCYAAGLVATAFATDGLTLALSAGVLIGLGLSGAGFAVVMGVIGRNFSDERRSVALGIAGAGGSIGQFAMLPFGQALIDAFGWQYALMVIGCAAALMVPLGIAMTSGLSTSARRVNVTSIAGDVHTAAAELGFWLLTFSFFVCGFQTVFIMIHFPAFLMDHGMSAQTGMLALALIGLTNVFGAYGLGHLAARFPKKHVLAMIYLVRAVAIVLFLAVPVSIASVVAFSIGFGATFLGTVPVTNALIAHMYGVRSISTLFGIAFLGHQLGGFAGAWLGGYAFDATGSYTGVWVISAALSGVAAITCWPVREQRLAPVAALTPAEKHT